MGLIYYITQVQFDFGKSTIRKVSDPLLDSVAQVLKEHPEVLKLEVQGHTDNKGSKPLNDKLSQDRAQAVMDALVKRGVESGRPPSMFGRRSDRTRSAWLAAFPPACCAP